MFEYSKLILKKVSFDKNLLKKEFEKALTYLSKEEQKEFKHWYQQHYYIQG